MGGAIQLPWQEDNVADVVEAEDLSQLRHLLAERADANALSRSTGSSALAAAACNNRSDVVTLLLAARAEVNLRVATDSGRTALHQAALHGCAEACLCLFEQRADPEALDEEGYTALHLASLEGRCDVLRGLIDGKANLQAKVIEQVPSWGCEALHLAVLAGRHEAARCLLDAKASVNFVTSGPLSQISPLLCAALHGRANFIPLLVEAKADPEAHFTDVNPELEEDDVPETPLLGAAYENDVDSCRALLESRSCTETVDTKHRTALMIATDCQASDVIRFLVAQQADLESRDGDGHTALVRACESRNEVAAALLRELGEDDQAKNSAGVTACDLVRVAKGRPIELPDSCRFFSACPAGARTLDVGGRRKAPRWLHQ
mmetsp:Transcript_159247/g.510890  ORF Transcript_159247/g.510890 Transcript_159247/m.510890 type:complete len:377 (+) Transcript_159247:52-1182(+)